MPNDMKSIDGMMESADNISLKCKALWEGLEWNLHTAYKWRDAWLHIRPTKTPIKDVNLGKWNSAERSRDGF